MAYPEQASWGIGYFMAVFGYSRRNVFTKPWIDAIM